MMYRNRSKNNYPPRFEYKKNSLASFSTKSCTGVAPPQQKNKKTSGFDIKKLTCSQAPAAWTPYPAAPPFSPILSNSFSFHWPRVANAHAVMASACGSNRFTVANIHAMLARQELLRGIHKPVKSTAGIQRLDVANREARVLRYTDTMQRIVATPEAGDQEK